MLPASEVGSASQASERNARTEVRSLKAEMKNLLEEVESLRALKRDDTKSEVETEGGLASKSVRCKGPTECISMLVALVQGAKYSVDVTFNNITHPGLVEELCVAAERGCELRVILDAEDTSAESSVLDKLEKAGANIRLYSAHLSYVSKAKMLICDGSVASWGEYSPVIRPGSTTVEMTISNDLSVVKQKYDDFLRSWRDVRPEDQGLEVDESLTWDNRFSDKSSLYTELPKLAVTEKARDEIKETKISTPRNGSEENEIVSLLKNHLSLFKDELDQFKGEVESKLNERTEEKGDSFTAPEVSDFPSPDVLVPSIGVTTSAGHSVKPSDVKVFVCEEIEKVLCTDNTGVWSCMKAFVLVLKELEKVSELIAPGSMSGMSYYKWCKAAALWVHSEFLKIPPMKRCLWRFPDLEIPRLFEGLESKVRPLLDAAVPVRIRRLEPETTFLHKRTHSSVQLLFFLLLRAWDDSPRRHQSLNSKRARFPKCVSETASCLQEYSEFLHTCKEFNVCLPPIRLVPDVIENLVKHADEASFEFRIQRAKFKQLRNIHVETDWSAMLDYLNACIGLTALVPDVFTKTDKPKVQIKNVQGAQTTAQVNSPCRYWCDAPGCRFGNKCKFEHKRASLKPEMCMNCSMKGHKKTECRRPGGGAYVPRPPVSGQHNVQVDANSTVDVVKAVLEHQAQERRTVNADKREKKKLKKVATTVEKEGDNKLGTAVEKAAGQVQPGVLRQQIESCLRQIADERKKVKMIRTKKICDSDSSGVGRLAEELSTCPNFKVLFDSGAGRFVRQKDNSEVQTGTILVEHFEGISTAPVNQQGEILHTENIASMGISVNSGRTVHWSKGECVTAHLSELDNNVIGEFIKSRGSEVMSHQIEGNTPMLSQDQYETIRTESGLGETVSQVKQHMSRKPMTSFALFGDILEDFDNEFDTREKRSVVFNKAKASGLTMGELLALWKQTRSEPKFIAVLSSEMVDEDERRVRFEEPTTLKPAGDALNGELRQLLGIDVDEGPGGDGPGGDDSGVRDDIDLALDDLLGTGWEHRTYNEVLLDRLLMSSPSVDDQDVKVVSRGDNRTDYHVECSHMPKVHGCLGCDLGRSVQGAAKRGAFTDDDAAQGESRMFADLRGRYETSFSGNGWNFICRVKRPGGLADLLYSIGIPRKNTASIKWAVWRMLVEFRLETKRFVLHSDREGAIAEGAIMKEFLVDHGGRITLGLSNRPTSHATEEATVRVVSELLCTALVDSALDRRHWDSVAEYVTMQRNAVNGLLPRTNRCKTPQIGVLGHINLPKGVIARMKAEPRATTAVFVGLDFLSAKGARVEFWDPGTDSLRQTIIHDDSCRWSDTMAYSWQRAGLRMIATPTELVEDDSFETVPEIVHKYEYFSNVWVACDLCKKWRRLPVEAEGLIQDESGEIPEELEFTCTDVGLGCFWPQEPEAEGEFHPAQGEGVIYEVTDYTIRNGEEMYLCVWSDGSETWEKLSKIGQDVRDQAETAKHAFLHKCKVKIVATPEESQGDIFISCKTISEFKRWTDELDQEADMLLNSHYEKESVYVTLPIHGQRDRMKYPYLDFDKARDTECEVLRSYDTVGEAREFRDAKAVINATFASLLRVDVVKNWDGPEAEHQARTRVVYGGHRITDSNGQKAVFQRRYMLPASLREVRAFIACATLLGFKILQIDVSGAYLHASIPDDSNCFVFIPPDLLPAASDKERERASPMLKPVFRLRKALYGHPHAGFMWDEHFQGVLTSVGFARKNDVSTSTWILRNKSGDIDIMCIVFVDDALIAGREKKVRSLMSRLKDLVNVKGVDDIERFLGCKYNIRDESEYLRTVDFDMSRYNQHMADQYFADPSAETVSQRAVFTPGTEDAFRTGEPGRLVDTCRKHVGAALFNQRCAGVCEFETVHGMAKRVTCWEKREDKAMSRYMVYKRQNQDEVSQNYIDVRDLEEGALALVSFADSDYAGDLASRKSTTGSVWILIGKFGTFYILDWSSKVQKCVTNSTGEAELTALHSTAKEHVSINMYVEFLLCKELIQGMYSDSSCAREAIQAGFSQRMKSVSKTQGVSISWLHDMYRDKLFCVLTDYNPADILTKGLPREAFQKHRAFLQTRSMSDASKKRCSNTSCVSLIFGKMRCKNVVANTNSSLCVECSSGTCNCWYGGPPVGKTYDRKNPFW